MERLVPAREAARILGVSARHVARLAARRELVFESSPLGRLYDRAALERRLAQPPRRGRPPRRRPAPVPPPEPVAPVENDTPVFVEQTATLVDDRGQPLSVFQAGYAYLVSEEIARLLINGGHARGIE